MNQDNKIINLENINSNNNDINNNDINSNDINSNNFSKQNINNNSENEEFMTLSNSNSNNNNTKNIYIENDKLINQDELVESAVPNITVEKLSDNNSNKNIDLFSNNENDVFYFKNNVVVENSEKVFEDDIIYIQDLENNLLDQYPIYKQNYKYIQDKIKKDVFDIIFIKNYGIELLKRDDNYSSMIDNILNNNYIYDWILPVVEDKKILYYIKNNKVNDSDNTFNINKESEKYMPFIQKYYKKENYYFKNFIDNIKEIDKITNDLKKNNLNIKDYLKIYNDITKSYINLYKKDLNGFNIEASDDITCIRRTNLRTKKWETRVLNGDFYTYVNVCDDNDRIVNVNKKILINSDKININGFLIFKNKFDHIKNYSKINKMTNISSIIFNDNNVIIKAKNHKIINGGNIYLKNTNSIPPINGYYDFVDVIDENTLRLNNVANKGTKKINGNTGILYARKILLLKKINVDKKNNKLVYSNPEKDIKEFSAYYYNFNFNLSKEDLKNVLIDILPNNNDIINILESHIDKIKTTNDLYKILDIFKLNINELSNEEFKLIKEIIKKVYKSDLIFKDKIDKLYNKINIPRNIIDYKDSIFDKGFINKNINTINKYYSNNFVNQDKLIDRINWIENQIDNGELYFNFISKKNNENTHEKEFKYIKNTIKNIKDNEKKIKNLPKQNVNCKNYKLRIIKVINDSNFDLNNKDSFYVDRLMHGIDDRILINGQLWSYENNEWIEDPMKYNDGDLALVIVNENEYLNLFRNNDNTSEYIYKNNKWIFHKKLLAGITNINTACFFSKIDIKNMNNQLKINNDYCYYYNDKCLPVKKYKEEKLIIDLNKILDNYNKYIESDTINELNKHIEINENNLIKYPNIIENKKEEDLNKNIIKNKNTNFSIQITSLIDRIYKINDVDIQKYLLYKIIENDGILVDNFIYSKKYGKKIICGHWKLLMDEDYADNNNLKEKIRETLLNIYSDRGVSESSYQVCKICGNYLENVKYSLVEGYSSSGRLIMSREVLDNESDNPKKKSNNLKYYKNLDCNDKDFKNELINRNIDIQYYNTIKFICDKFTSFSNKIGINFNYVDSLEIIFDTFEQFVNIPSYIIYKKKQIMKFKSKGYDSLKINNILKKNIIKNNYETYISLNLNTLLMSRLLITINTSNPKYIKNETLSSKCTFYGWRKEDKVFDFLACILVEGNSIKFNNNNLSFEQKMEILKIDLNYNYSKFKNLGKIRKLFENNIGNNIGNITNKQLDNKQTILKIIKEVPILPNNFKNDILKSTSINKIKSLYNLLHKRANFVNKSLYNIINTQISESDLLGGLLIENYCCPVNLSLYKSYDNYFKDINELINESFNLYKNEKYFLNTGNISKLYVLKDNKLHNYNYAIQPDNISIKEINNFKDNVINENNNFNDEIVFIDYENKKKDLIKIIKDSLNKQKKWVNDFSLTYSNLGVLSCLKYDQNTNVNNNISKNNSKNAIIKNLKKFYYLLVKSINIIKNKYKKVSKISKIDFVNEATSKELQSKIYTQHNFLDEYINDTYQIKFKNIVIKYKNYIVSNIFGINDVYNCKNVIIKKSKFTKNDAIKKLRFIITDQLLNMYNNNDNKIISLFIIKLIEKYNMNIGKFDIKNKDIDNYRSRIDYEFSNEYKIKIDSLSGATKTMIKNHFKTNSLDTFDTKSLQDYNSVDVDKNEKDMSEFLKNMAKKELDSIHENVTEEHISEYVNEYLKEKRIDEEILKDEYDFTEADENIEIIDVGTEYGDIPQGTENAGRGINDFTFDYSSQFT